MLLHIANALVVFIVMLNIALLDYFAWVITYYIAAMYVVYTRCFSDKWLV